MPTTPNWELPYPLDTDPADVPADMEELAVRLDSALDEAAALGIPIGGPIPWLVSGIPAGYREFDGSPIVERDPPAALRDLRRHDPRPARQGHVRPGRPRRRRRRRHGRLQGAHAQPGADAAPRAHRRVAPARRRQPRPRRRQPRPHRLPLVRLREPRRARDRQRPPRHRRPGRLRPPRRPLGADLAVGQHRSAPRRPARVWEAPATTPAGGLSGVTQPFAILPPYRAVRWITRAA